MSRTLLAFAAVALITFSGCGGGGDGGPSSAELTAGRTQALRYVPDDAVGAIVLYPQRLAASQAFKGVDWKATPPAEKTNLTPEDVEQVHIFFGAPAPPRGEPPINMVMRFKDGTDVEKLASKMAGNKPQTSKEGDLKIFHREANMYNKNNPEAYLVADKRTIVMSRLQDIKAFKDEKKSSRALVDLVKTGKTDGVARGYFVMAPMKEMTAKLAENLKEHPDKNFKELADLPDQVKSATAVVHVDGKTLAEVNIEADSSKTATSMKSAIDGGLAMVKLLYKSADVRKNMSRGAPPEAEPLFDMIDEVVASLAVSSSGSTVQITAATPKNFSTLGEKILGPTLTASKKQAEESEALYRLSRVARAIGDYERRTGKLPADILDKDGKPLLSWRVQVLPVIFDDLTIDQFKLDEPWDSDHNKKLLGRMPYSLGGNFSEEDSPTKTRYLAFTGDDALFGGKLASLSAVQDGLKDTIAVVEVAEDKAVPWTKPADLKLSDDPAAAIGKVEVIRVGFLDGSVYKLKQGISAKDLRALITPNGKEQIDRAKLIEKSAGDFEVSTKTTAVETIESPATSPAPGLRPTPNDDE